MFTYFFLAQAHIKPKIGTVIREFNLPEKFGKDQKCLKGYGNFSKVFSNVRIPWQIHEISESVQKCLKRVLENFWKASEIFLTHCFMITY